MGALTIVVIVVALVIGIVYYKNKKQRRTSVRQEFEIPQYADILSDSRERNTSQISEHYYEVIEDSKEYVNVESSSQLPPMKMGGNVAYGVGLAQTSGVEGGEYEVVQPQAPAETPTESAAPHGMTVNVAYGVAGHMM